MDSLADKEYNAVFNRVAKRVNLQGCSTPHEIEIRLNNQIHDNRATYGISPLRAMQAEGECINLQNLVASGFARRAIDEAIAKPEGKIALTLKYGREKAKRIIEKRKHRIIW
jgi:hypothetical protein